MKGEILDYPFNGYIGYKILHKKLNRFYMCLISIDNKSKRTTVSYARYLMSVKLGRILEKTEHVDHIDGDRTNDILSNLQILTPQENNIKMIKETGKTAVKTKMICPICDSKFFVRKGNDRPGRTCSRTCGGKKSSQTFILNKNNT